jgi:hypothetical protein
MLAAMGTAAEVMSLTDVVLEAFEAAGAEAGLVYVTVPITSGRREFRLLHELGCTRDELRTRFRDRWLHEVVHPNEEEAKELAGLTRTTFACALVVDPSRLHVTEWTQEDFDKLWTVLIEGYARVVVVSPDWAFSRGARLEVALALSLGVPLADPFGRELTASDVAAMVEEAEAELRHEGWSAEAIRAMLPEVPVDAAPRRPGRPPLFERAAAHAFGWLTAERTYQLGKFGTDLDDEHTRQGLHQDGWWWRQLTNYFGRAHVLGVENPSGRQALAKFTATACGLLESVVRVHGDLPAPGVPSGELRMSQPDRPTP